MSPAGLPGLSQPRSESAPGTSGSEESINELVGRGRPAACRMRLTAVPFAAGSRVPRSCQPRKDLLCDDGGGGGAGASGQLLGPRGQESGRRHKQPIRGSRPALWLLISKPLKVVFPQEGLPNKEALSVRTALTE